MKLFIAYLRVSTLRQGASGLGLEAQRDAVVKYIESVGGQMIGEYVEIESSKKKRPILDQALHMCKLTGATLTTAKLDRLARCNAFVANLLKSGVDFVPADLPEANTMMLQMLSVIAEYERKQIVDRTTAALKACKARGPRFCDTRQRSTFPLGIRGSENLFANPDKVVTGRTKGTQATKLKADDHAKGILPIIQHHRAAGLSYSMTAKKLNEANVKTARDSKNCGNNTILWTARSVLNVINRHVAEAVEQNKTVY